MVTMATSWAFLVVVKVVTLISGNTHLQLVCAVEGAKYSVKLKIYVVVGISKHGEHVVIVKWEGIDDGLTVYNNSLRTVHV